MLVFKVPLILLVNQVERMVQMGTHNDIFLEKLILTLWLRILHIRNCMLIFTNYWWFYIKLKPQKLILVVSLCFVAVISWAYGFINYSTSTVSSISS